MRNISVRMEDEKLKRLDEIAKAENQDRSSLINKLVETRIELFNWQLAKIDRGLSQLDKGEYSKDTEIIKLLVN